MMICKKQILFFYLLLFIIFYVINYFTPYCSDDWVYMFRCDNDENIRTFQDVIYSQFYHYTNVNGRFTPHFVLQLFDGILGKAFFNFFNAFNFVLLLYILVKITLKDNIQLLQHIGILILSVILICFFFPGFKMCFLWMTGSCNYLFSAVLLLLFHRLLFKNFHHKQVYWLLFIFGILCGLTHEGLVLGLAVGYFVYFFLHQDQFTSHKKYQLLGFYIGCILLIFSPGSMHRASLSNLDVSFSIIGCIKSYIVSLFLFKNLCILPILVIVIFIFYLKESQLVKKILSENVVFLVSLIITFLFVWFTRHDSLRSRFGIEFYSLIILLQFAKYLPINKTMLFVVSMTIAGLCPVIFYRVHANYLLTREYCHQIEQQGPNCILYFQVRDYIPIIDRFVLKFALPDQEKYYFNFSQQSIENRLIAKVYGKTSVRFLPLDFKESLKQGDEYLNFQIKNKLPFYARQISANDTVQKVTFYLNEHFGTSLEKIQYRTFPLQVDTKDYSVIELYGKRYVLVKRNEAFDNRVDSISLTIN